MRFHTCGLQFVPHRAESAHFPPAAPCLSWSSTHSQRCSSTPAASSARMMRRSISSHCATGWRISVNCRPHQVGPCGNRLDLLVCRIRLPRLKILFQCGQEGNFDPEFPDRLLHPAHDSSPRRGRDMLVWRIISSHIDSERWRQAAWSPHVVQHGAIGEAARKLTRFRKLAYSSSVAQQMGRIEHPSRTAP